MAPGRRPASRGWAVQHLLLLGLLLLGCAPGLGRAAGMRGLLQGGIKPRMPNNLITDWGYPSMSHGWYDAQCQGALNDYCRYVGDAPNVWWSCALAGGTSSDQQNSLPGQFTEASTSTVPCGSRPIKPRMPDALITDKGYTYMSHGWYDAMCQGAANDYCRYVGDQPNVWWSCALAGGTDQNSSPGQFTEAFTSATPCSPAKKYRMADAMIPDKGFSYMPHGWYDAQCQGVANDYCRWVGDHPNVWWSCALAGGTSADEPGTTAGLYTQNSTSQTPCMQQPSLPCPSLPGFDLVPGVTHTGDSIQSMPAGTAGADAAQACLNDCSCLAFSWGFDGAQLLSKAGPISNSPPTCLYLRQNFTANNCTSPATAGTGKACYTHTVTRGVGTIPDACPADNPDKSGALCYPSCKAGFTGVSFVCWQNCPNGYTDTGVDCLKPAAYGRGAGYPWEFGDGFNLDGATARCQRDNPQGCEQWGLMMYPKCAPGFHPVGCCVCSPDCPNGLTDIGVSCQKQSYTRTAGVPMTCGAGKEYDAGLCYPPCPTGYKGVGPVCWQETPPTGYPVRCNDISFATDQTGCGALGTAMAEVVIGAVGTIASVVESDEDSEGVNQDAVQLFMTGLQAMIGTPICPAN